MPGPPPHVPQPLPELQDVELYEQAGYLASRWTAPAHGSIQPIPQTEWECSLRPGGHLLLTCWIRVGGDAASLLVWTQVPPEFIALLREQWAREAVSHACL